MTFEIQVLACNRQAQQCSIVKLVKCSFRKMSLVTEIRHDSNCRYCSLNTAKTNNRIYVVYVYVERKDIDVNKHEELSNYSIMSINHSIQLVLNDIYPAFEQYLCR